MSAWSRKEIREELGGEDLLLPMSLGRTVRSFPDSPSFYSQKDYSQ